ncbi:hypothetical protein AMS68_004066 [Peltaster fructicola]|uniref:tRNA-splicing endonuclease subunit Sen34 n=1 Tax=Peltaster fructicola TaxID=286661 RepID=A0A6H0XV98_9PEZI|nr:hypothetical protein AMS68_004066 [Peltaster fructicola]
MATQVPAVPVQEPFPIFMLAHKYLIYDPNVIAHIRQAYNISGVLIGSLPQAPQQNVFLGAPLELMPEEARLLVEKEVGYIVDDVKAHKQNFLNGGLSLEERKAYQDALRKQGSTAANEASKRTEERKKTALKQKAEQAASGDWNDIPEDMLRPPTGPRKKSGMADDNTPTDEAKKQETEDDPDNALFSTPVTSTLKSAVPAPMPLALTPTTSQPPLKYANESRPLPDVSASYDLYKYMHDKDYFLAPGLRFGCQYMAYPGDPLRFHSHFLCNGMDWDQEFDLLDIVGGGRLGTGVKKGFLIGGKEVNEHASGEQSIRPFCIEWAGM